MRSLAFLLTLLLAPAIAVAGVTVTEVRTWQGPDHVRVVFDLSAPVSHDLFILDGPHRAVVDIADAELAPTLVDTIRDEGPIQRVRSARRGDGVRVVFDLDRAIDTESFSVAPNEQYGHRLVVDLQTGPATPAGAGDAVITAASAEGDRAPVRTADAAGAGDFLVAIDAGHGGEDPGAIGAAGTYEKDIVLSVARRLAKRVDAVAGMRALLIRDGDYYIGLRDRTRKAREADADLFVSVHADAFRDRSVKGSSVFVLSRNGASSEMARMLARSENRADRIGGVSLDDKDPEVASVLLDLSRAHTVEESLAFAAKVKRELGAIGDVHGSGVEQAGFAVLKSLDMPSALVELAFISNPEEERRLRSADYQAQLARGIVNGIRAYAAATRPDLRLAGGEYTVRRGDTLSEIAVRYSVSVDSLRDANNLGGSMISAGRTLQIP